MKTTQNGAATVYSAPKGPSSAIDYQNAKPMPLPQGTLKAASGTGAASQDYGLPQVFPGNPGTGQLHPATLPVPAEPKQPSNGYQPQDYGTANLPFTTVRAAAFGDNTQNYYPFRASGKLYFKISGASYICSASMIKPGIAVTAAHCVSNFGKSQFYSDWQYVPAQNNSTAPYGVWNVARALVLTSYFNGTDKCYQKGVVCTDDVAVLILQSQNGTYAGQTTGWYGYGINGYSYVSNTASITQLGYPGAFDNGLIMERNNAQGVVSSTYSSNTLMGSLMTGGSSGGPWLVNFGMAPSLSGTAVGKAPNTNIVVGVTSFGSTNDAYKRQGASRFTSTNIQTLVTGACNLAPGAC